MQQTPFTQGVAAFRGFDLDNVRAKLAQDLGGKGPAINWPSSRTQMPPKGEFM